MSTIAAVLFDLGNVLVSIHPERFAATLGLDPERRAIHRTRVIELMRRYESGAVESDTFFDTLSGIFEGSFTRTKLLEAMESVIGEPIPGMPELLQRVASTTAVAMVSNTNEIHFDYCQRTFPFVSHIPRRFLSWKMKVMKPDPAYYRIVTRELAVSVRQLVFIDDLSENVQAAEREGMKGILFQGTDRLRHALNDLSIL